MGFYQTTWESNAAILSSVFNNSGKVQRYVSAPHLLKAALSVVDVFGVFFFVDVNTKAHDGMQIYIMTYNMAWQMESAFKGVGKTRKATE